jgi:hypothetical protein
MKSKKWYLVSIAVVGMALLAAVTSGKEGKEKMAELPNLAIAAIQSLFPSATVEKAEPEDISIAGYEVELKVGTEVKSAIVSSEGAVVSVESKVAAETLPAAVSKAISEKAKGAQILGVEKEDVFMEPQLVKLAQPKTTYEAKVTLEGKTYEIVVDGAGTVLEMKAAEGDEGEKGKEAGKEEKEGDDDEQVIALDKLPDVVKTAIVNASQGGTVKKVISEEEDGKITYEAEAVIGGQEFEIKVDADGKVLEKKAEKDDDKDKGDKADKKGDKD